VGGGPAAATATETAVAEDADLVMLVRPRKSRIYFLRKLFEYPISLNAKTLRQQLGLVRTIRIGISYVWSALFPLKREETLEQFLINRFGRELYRTFSNRTRKRCGAWPAAPDQRVLGAQRIKGLSLAKTLLHAIQGKSSPRHEKADIAQKDTETSLIEQFLYPKLGPGQHVGRSCAACEGARRDDPDFPARGWHQSRGNVWWAIETDGPEDRVAAPGRGRLFLLHHAGPRADPWDRSAAPS